MYLEFNNLGKGSNSVFLFVGSTILYLDLQISRNSLCAPHPVEHIHCQYCTPLEFHQNFHQPPGIFQLFFRPPLEFSSFFSVLPWNSIKILTTPWNSVVLNSMDFFWKSSFFSHKLKASLKPWFDWTVSLKLDMYQLFCDICEYQKLLYLEKFNKQKNIVHYCCFFLLSNSFLVRTLFTRIRWLC